MNQNTEYEKFTQEIYQELNNAKGITTIVEHNVKLTGKSGQKHQIDVYWEYEIANVRYKVAIECKNYNRKLSIDKVNAFRGLLDDFIDVRGIMITKKGYQTGAKKIADSCGINLKELRVPNEDDDCNIGEVNLSFKISRTRRLFLIDEDWCKANNRNLSSLQDFLSFFLQQDATWMKDGYLPLSTIRDQIINEKRQIIKTINKVGNILPQEAEHIYSFENAYIDTRELGRVKIKAIKYINSKTEETKIIGIDARNMVKAILKDALNGDIIFFLGSNAKE